MRRAVELAARGLGSTSPNPVVGCVVLSPEGYPVGEGWHQRAGGPHAEIHALAEAGDDARGGTAVVTLEPCDHTGRTGPCSEALIEAGIARVVYAVADPSATGGAQRLAAAGLDVVRGLLADEAAAGNAAWLTSVRLKRPYVVWKYAATLDGRIAAADGSSRWITSDESRADVHRLRARTDAVLVGSGTARADDPHLAVRGVPGAVQPLRIVADTEAAAVRPGARVLDGTAPTLLAVAEDADTGGAAGSGELEGAVEVLRLPRAGGGRPGLDLAALLQELYARDVRSLLLEGGPTLAAAFVRAGAVDEVIGYVAPVLLGAGPAALGDAGIATIAQALRLKVTETARLGPDLRITAVPEESVRAGATGAAAATTAAPAVAPAAATATGATTAVAASTGSTATSTTTAVSTAVTEES
ncbi:bifunctional diaminohydroxyphosphoribosylaminopyrimidine deaminase/5-amino-6-(5-phosphoribosylamino)uracil reductase RibD [Streptomyces sp. HNM0575]|uniref:bifunctional diaminohydroxyphosphoribosylaminopyrimidine deaminase/5-amino-6-(5-phosphoribosylamino)uracil reductase RibD n=1 Tax=Streptomyces sp. HNM0575 TaxID=2716338 RepID=UPI00145D1DEB|nr:bifunctional diaminohydroxyphosphoribosylaminopyrimidine deaminase/5-amino-6-(5-phosphoribosylamino)uracil reductase RibD [Streptomyces sp. HNM0575]NLU73273.1 bifunctional diaminohydroxyphosphoribosylaminopyrimidine deaminase/5-amino-6-(5-phosphoribosylamino)uracil reductase RibD [Streptomyces sp. HNM0575]